MQSHGQLGLNADLLDNKHASAFALAAAAHAPVTLDSNADALLSLSTQALGLDTQVKNTVLVGPTTGADAVPTFRALVVADIPAAFMDADWELGVGTNALQQPSAEARGVSCIAEGASFAGGQALAYSAYNSGVFTMTTTISAANVRVADTIWAQVS
jgi:hypothetical protein